jgi:hypothetical protein
LEDATGVVHGEPPIERAALIVGTDAPRDDLRLEGV